MAGKKWLLALLIITMVLSPTLSLAQTGSGGSGGNSLATFLTDLEILIPTVLFIMSLLALRGGDYEYAFTLFLASVIAVAGLSAYTSNSQTNYPALVILHVQIIGQTQYYTGNTGTYIAYWTPQKTANVNWTVLLNGTQVYKTEQQNVNPGGAKLTYQFNQTGIYTIEAVVWNQQEYAVGGSAVVVQVTPPPSPLGWIEGAITGAFYSILSTAMMYVSYIMEFLQYLSLPLDLMLFSPTPQMLQNSIIFLPGAVAVESFYNQVMSYAIGIALLMISFSVVYNALQGYYTDIIDIASDLFYKIGVWLLFTFGGLDIYSFVANFINDIIWSVTGSSLGLATIEIALGMDELLASAVGVGVVPFIGGDAKVLIGNLLTLLSVSVSFGVLRFAMMLAIVVTIPLWATLWLFEWTRGIAMRVIDTLIGLMIGGLVMAFTIAILVYLDVILLLIFLLPIILDVELVLTVLVFTMLSPMSYASGMKFKQKTWRMPSPSSSPPQSQPAPQPPAPQSPPPPPPQKQSNLAYI